MTDLIKQVRTATGAGLMSCKEALEATASIAGTAAHTVQEHISAAIKWLREKGAAQVSKLQSRTVHEGLAAMCLCKSCGVLLYVGCESDFVAKNKIFGELAYKLAELGCQNNLDTIAQVEAFAKDVLEAATLALREKIELLKYYRFEGKVAGYVHRIAQDSIEHTGKHGCILAYTGDDATTARDIAKHVVANKTDYLTADTVSQELLQHEIDIMQERMINEGKDTAIAERIAQAHAERIKKDSALMTQPFFMDEKSTVEAVCQQAKLGITAMARV